MNMNTKKLTFLIVGCLSAAATVFAQDKSPAKFGKISPADFNLSAYQFDTAAGAVVIADVGYTEFKGNMKGWFSLEFHHFKRIKILKKGGFTAGDVEIPLYSSGTEVEKIESLKAITYNLENGKVTETKLDDKSIFTDKMSRNWIEKKFTFPAIKENSIIEFSYVQVSDFLYNMQPWAFQGQYPCLWSEYEANIPNFFEYVTLSQGYLPFAHQSSSTTTKFQVTIPGGSGRDEQGSFEDAVVDHRWTMKNIPALKEEPYTTTLNNHIAKIEFQLSRFQFPNSGSHDMMGNWLTVSQGLLKEEDFGSDLDRNNGWLDDDLKKITGGAANRLEAAEKIYCYVRDNFNCTGHGSIYMSNPIKTVFKDKHGSAAELNLLLIAMMKHEKIIADPVILSTRAHGFTHEFYPLLTRFNYVIGRIRIDSTQFYLDASSPVQGFGQLPDYCYNGHARVVSRELPEAVYFDADSVKEAKLTMVLITNQEKGALTGRLETKPGTFEAFDIREKIKKSGEKEFFKTVQSAYPAETVVFNPSIDSLRIPEMPLGISYEFKMKIDSGENLLYFTPLLAEGYKDNPFSAAVRTYPVEMPSATDEIFVLNMEIPEGYVVDELPKSAKVLFNDDEGFFEYMVDKDDANVRLRSRIKLKKANYKPEDYNTLRDFFGFIVKKQSEQIVFKKKA
jgi:transglutaminase superfamily protein